MQHETNGPLVYGIAHILWSIEDEIVLIVSRSQSLTTSKNLSVLYILIAFFEGEGGLKVTELGHLRNQNQMINYFFRDFVPLKILSQKSTRTHKVCGWKKIIIRLQKYCTSQSYGKWLFIV